MQNRVFPKTTFGPNELGIFDDAPNRAFDTIVATSAEHFAMPNAAFFVLDDAKGSLLARATKGLPQLRNSIIGLSLSGSLANLVRSEGTTIFHTDLSQDPELCHSVESHVLNIVSYIGSPVPDPAGEIIGVLATMSPYPRQWTKSDQAAQENFAHLLNQQIMLRASLETLRLISVEKLKIG